MATLPELLQETVGSENPTNRQIDAAITRLQRLQQTVGPAGGEKLDNTIQQLVEFRSQRQLQTIAAGLETDQDARAFAPVQNGGTSPGKRKVSPRPTRSKTRQAFAREASRPDALTAATVADVGAGFWSLIFASLTLILLYLLVTNAAGAQRIGQLIQKGITAAIYPRAAFPERYSAGR